MECELRAGGRRVDVGLPVSISSIKRKIRAASLVKIDEDNPYWVSFATWHGFFESFTRKTESTGPNISSRAMRISGVT